MSRKYLNAPKKPPTKAPDPTRTKQVGLGKGSPGMPRKEKVSQRQERKIPRKRLATSPCVGPAATKRAVTGSEQHSAQPSQGPTQPSLILEEDSTQASISSEAESTSSELPSTSGAEPLPRRPMEERKRLTIQTKRPVKEKQVNVIRALSGTNRDEQPNGTELTHFWNQMDNWTTLDQRIVMAFTQVWNEAVNAIDGEMADICRELVKLQSLVNGVKNCVCHLRGYLLREGVLKRCSEDESDQMLMETIGQEMENLKYRKYVDALEKCGCDSCNAVVDFDRRYTEYHDAIDDGEEPTSNEPIYADRPTHCDFVEPYVHSLRTEYSGFGVTSLQNCVYFANSTGLFSPPAISTSSHTALVECTIRYMTPYLQDRKLQDPLPQSWRNPPSVIKMDDLIEIDKANIHFYDGDSAEIVVEEETALSQLICSGEKTLRIRMLHCDAPEVKFAVRLFKQAEDSTTMTTYVTRDIGLESLRAVRKRVHEATRVFLEIPNDGRGNPLLSKDVYKRFLANIVVESRSGELENLAVSLASQGYTLSFYADHGIDEAIDQSMRQAIDARRGMFNLPEEVFAYPYRPWDLRRKWDSHRGHYSEYRPISNVPDDPNSEWRGMLEGHGDVVEESQPRDQFFFRFVLSTAQHESLCFKAKSTIPNAGRGLFLKPHGLIRKGEHLCLYAEKETNEAELEHSSRDYVIETNRRGTVYDAQEETGNNLGRFANQPLVLECLEEMRQRSTRANFVTITTEEWSRLDAKTEEACNGEFCQVGCAMTIRAKKDLKATWKPEEVFVSYGRLLTYWIPALYHHTERFPRNLAEIVQWLASSSECNWTDEQRRNWLRL